MIISLPGGNGDSGTGKASDLAYGCALLNHKYVRKSNVTYDCTMKYITKSIGVLYECEGEEGEKKNQK